MPVEGIFSTTINVLDKSIDLRARNQNLIASNLANAETPNYTPKALAFEEQLQSATKRATLKKGGAASAPTHPSHFPVKGAGTSVKQVSGKVVEVPAKTPGKDGNSVELENEMSRMMENQVMYNASVQLLSKKFEGLRSALREGK